MKLTKARRFPMLVRLGIVWVLVASMALMFVVPALAQPAPLGEPAHSTAGPQPPSDEFTTTEQYLITFYPRWFTHNQWRQSTHNRTAGPDRISPLYQVVVAINDDTLYASSVMELASQPVVVTIPATVATYSILSLDAYGNVLDTKIPKQMPGMYVLTGPGFNDPLPPELTPVPMPLNDFFMIFRADKHAPDGQNLIAEAQLFRAKINMQPLCAYEGLPCPADIPPGGDTLIVPEAAFAIPYKTIADTMIRLDPIAFLRELQVAVASPGTPPMSPSEQALSDHFDALFGTGDVGRKSDYAAGAQAGHQAILDNYLNNVGSTQWIHFTDMGHWGDNVLNRASITEFIQYGNDISAAAYYHTFNDEKGKPLNGNNKQGYVLTFPPGALPEAGRFWSITAYTPISIELVDNPANKYLVARYTPGLVYNSDGSLTVYMTTELQPGVPPANWLPIPKGPFNIMLRVYGVVPGSDVANNTYVPPPVVKSRGGGVGSGGLTIDPNNVRILLYRTYLQTGGYDQIPLPDISLVINGREVALPQCNNRGQVLNADYSKLQDAFANGDNLANIISTIQKTANIPAPQMVDGLPVFCAWWFPVDVKTLNIAFPDAAAVYWVMPFLVDVQDEAIIRGTYSNARYISFALYNSSLDPYTYTLPNNDVIKSFIADYQISPDDGSLNPWQVQAQPGGHYTLRIKKDITEVEPNVLPFLQDQALGGFVGSFPMPAPCNTPGSPYACTWGGMFTSPPAAAQSSVFSNPDNTYLPARLPAGPDDRVVVVRGKMPRTPPGTSPVPWPSQNYDVRYWSFCTADYVRPYPTVVEDGCVADKDIVVDENGYFTLVLSTKEARPEKSTAADGVNWLQVRSSINSLLIVRNMFGDDFPFSTQNVEKNGDWVSAFMSMQEYYPLITAECTTSHYNDNGSWKYCVAPSPLSEPGVGLPGTGSP